MKLARVLGVLLVALGVLALVTRGFTYTEDSHDAKLGPLEFSIREKQRVEIPTWAGVGAVAAGVGLLLLPRRR